MTYSPDIGRTFWYEFDLATQGSLSFMDVADRAGAFDIQEAYRDTRRAGTYPNAFLAGVQAQRGDWVTISDVQTNSIQRYLGSDWADIQAAFEDFGQGTLFDTHPDRAGNRIHMMDAGRRPPIGYHRWHASIRAIQLLGLGDTAWWEKLDTLVGLAWAVQSFKPPRQLPQGPNPPLPEGDLQQIRDAWLFLPPAARDAQFDLPSGQFFGYHPSPKQPVAVGVV